MRLDEQDNLYILEVNSLPSLGEHGSYVHGAAAAGLAFAALVNRLVDVASARYFGTPHPPDVSPRTGTVGDRIVSYLSARRDRMESELRDWTKLSSRTADPLGIQEAAAKLDKELREVGLKAIRDVAKDVQEFIAADVARAFVDLNRDVTDRSAGGIVKTHTIYEEPIYRKPLSESLIQELIAKYYRPCHATLSEWASAGLLFGVDCHTMAALAPPIASDAGTRRPEICIGDVHGTSLPPGWSPVFLAAMQDVFPEFDVTLNQPFAGGYITRSHASEMPWLQIEVSRSRFLPESEIRERLLAGLTSICERLG